MTELRQMLDKGLLTRDDASDPEVGAGQNERPVETEVSDLQQAKRLQIIDKSIALFSQFGYDAVKVSDITSASSDGQGHLLSLFQE